MTAPATVAAPTDPPGEVAAQPEPERPPAGAPPVARPAPQEFSLEIRPKARFEIIDVRERIRERHGPGLEQFPRNLFFSFHTTAGYLEQSFANRLASTGPGIEPFFMLFQTLFPADAGYRHDEMDQREELSEEQKSLEPRNADSHLTFIGAGLRSCVTYQNKPESPVYFIDLDGVFGEVARLRQTTAVGFHFEEVVAKTQIEVPTSGHPVDSINLKDPRTGLYEQINDLLQRHGVDKGRVRVVLAASERQAGLTVNEYETLLMQHDLREVLHDPLRYMAEKASHALADPRALPGRAVEYAKFDVVQVLNRFFEHFGWSESLVERAAARLLAFPANRFLRMKRSLSLLVSDRAHPGAGHIVQGTYQSPILVQWKSTQRHARLLDITLTRFR